MALIKCDGISIAYEGQTVVRDLSFWIEQGDYLCIVGENGSGKSTLVKSLLGLKPPFKGQILLGDGLKQDEIGYLPQQTVVQKDFPASVYEVVLSGRLNSRGWRPFYSAADKKAARENMELLGIREMEHQCFRDLSGGQKLLLRISGSSKIKGDAAIALISTGALAIGIMVISMTTGMNTDVYNYMFGSILAMSGEDVQFSILLSVAVLILYLFFYNKIFAITFDETFARATGVRANLYNTLIAVLTAVTIVLGMRMMGALLISSLIIFPALTSMRVFKTFKGVILNSAILSVVCLILGVTISYVYATPAGASVVVVNMAMLAVYSVIGALKNRNNGK